MKLFGKHLVLIDDASKALLDEAGHDILHAPISAGQALIAAFKASPEGQTVVSVMHTLNDQKLTGLQKAEQAAIEAEPLLLQFITGNGHSVVARVEDLAKEAVQSIFDDVFSAAKKAVGAVGTAAQQDEAQVVGTEPQAAPTPAAQPAPADLTHEPLDLTHEQADAAKGDEGTHE